MNLEESNEFVKELNDKKKKKRMVLISIIACLAVIGFLIFLIIFLKIQDSNTSKVFVNGRKAAWSNTLFISQNNKTYISVPEFAKLTGYEYVKGEYKKINEDSNYCSLRSNYEIITFQADTNKVKKYLVNSNYREDPLTTGNSTSSINPVSNVDAINSSIIDPTTNVPVFAVASKDATMELYEMVDNAVLVDSKIYIPLENAEKVFDVRMVQQGKSTYITTISQLYLEAQAVALRLTYPVTSGIFENVRAISNGMIVVKNSRNLYGVIDFSGKEVLSVKYKNIQYIQSTDDFFVYTDNAVGIISKDGKTVVEPKYDSLTVFDEVNKLFLAEKNKKYGIIKIDKEKKAVELVPTAYSDIGFKSIFSYEKFNLEEDECPNLIASKYIVVKEGSKFGLYDITGELSLDAKYEGVGYLSMEKEQKEGKESVLLIPKEVGVFGIVLMQNDFYGILNLEDFTFAIPCSLKKIYTRVEKGEKTYFFEDVEGEEVNIKNFFIENGIAAEPSPEPTVDPTDPEEPEEPEEPTEPEEPEISEEPEDPGSEEQPEEPENPEEGNESEDDENTGEQNEDSEEEGNTIKNFLNMF